MSEHKLKKLPKNDGKQIGNILNKMNLFSYYRFREFYNQKINGVYHNTSLLALVTLATQQHTLKRTFKS